MVKRIPLFQSHIEIAGYVTAFLTGKEFGDMHPGHNDDLFVERLQKVRAIASVATPTPLFGPRVGHSKKIVSIYTSPNDTSSLIKIPPNHKDETPFVGVYRPNEECDAIITPHFENAFGFFIATADCPVLLLYGKNALGKGYFAFIHCSRECLVKGIIGLVIREMTKLGCVPRELEAQTLPGIGHCCYGISPDNATELSEKRLDTFFLQRTQANGEYQHCKTGPRKGMISCNLPLGIGNLVHKSGVASGGARHFFCTCCSPDNYFSHSRGDDERNGMFVFVIPPPIPTSVLTKKLPPPKPNLKFVHSR